jgi:hypothetical protein
MKATIIVEDDPKTGRLVVSVHGEESPRETYAKRAMALIVPAVEKEFQPVKTWFVPVKGERKRS